MAMVWKCVVTGQRKRAIMSCFRMLPVYQLDRWVVIGWTPSTPCFTPCCTPYPAIIGLCVFHPVLVVSGVSKADVHRVNCIFMWDICIFAWKAAITVISKSEYAIVQPCLLSLISVCSTVVTCEIKLFQNDFQPSSTSDWNTFAYWNYFKIISEAYCNLWIFSVMHNVAEIILK